MPRKTKTTAAADKAAQPQFSAELLEQLIPGPVTPAELEGIFQQFKKSVLERALGAEMSHHLGVSGFLCVRLLNPSLNREAAW